jgi:hypothetical protein
MKTVILGDSNPNYMYIGQVDMEEHEILDHIQHGIPIKLSQTRIFQHQIMTVMTQRGPNTMASTKIFPFPLSNYRAEMFIKATTYIDSESTTDIAVNVRALMGACSDLEQKLRAQQSGIVMAHDIPKS